ncbi:MAG: cbb3-type cytochrome c oxidase subunit II, partial [Cognatishimia sp.]|nr:cbb3-type cytochrome c oxidase subunit II [Cognatishimia sp.]
SVACLPFLVLHFLNIGADQFSGGGSETRLNTKYLSGSLAALAAAGVPYTDEQIEWAARDAERQADPEAEYEFELYDLYGENLAVRDFDGNPNEVTEMDAIVAYLQMLGTLVDFDSIDQEEIAR